MNCYTQLTEQVRYQISADLSAGFNQTETALRSCVHKSTISRELKRNTGKRGYRPSQANDFALQRRELKAHVRISKYTWSTVESYLRTEWSPEQISGWLTRKGKESVSIEWIYQYIIDDKLSGGNLYKSLRCQKQRRKRYGSYSKRGIIANKVSIDDRPKVVDQKSRIGDWELDCVIGVNHKQALVTIVERKSKYTLIAKVTRKTSKNVTAALILLLKPFINCVHTLTADNGTEFSGHEKVAQELKTDFYFAHPYSSWERGLNENTNGLIRQYFSKKHDFTTITDYHVRKVMDKLNNRPRKTLGFKTPNEVFFGI